MAKAERIRREEAALILGVKGRTVVHLAVTGQLPGAAKIGRTWTFDEARLRAYVAEQEEEICQRSARPQRAAIGGMARSTAVLSSKALKSGSRLKEVMADLRERVRQSYEKEKLR